MKNIISRYTRGYQLQAKVTHKYIEGILAAKHANIANGLLDFKTKPFTIFRVYCVLCG